MHINNLATGSSPLIIHAPGLKHSGRRKMIHRSFNPCWIPIIENWKRQPSTSCRRETSEELTIITWNNTEEKGICERSLEKLGLDYLCLAKDIRHWRFIDKITTALEIIDSVKTPYIMALDCFDVIVLRDPHEAVEKFKKMHCDMLVNGEKNYHPDLGWMTMGKYAVTDKWKKYEESIAKSEWKFLNAGALIAKTPFYKEFLTRSFDRHKEIKKNQESFPLPPDPVYKKYPDYKVSNDDQLIHHWIYFDYFPRIMIDYKMDIFFNTIHTAFDKSKFEIADDIFTGPGALKYSVETGVLGSVLKMYLNVSKLMVMPLIVKNLFMEQFRRLL